MEHLLLLHGAVGASDQLQLLADELKDKHIVHRLNFIGHGGEVFPAEPFSIRLFANQVIEYLKEQKIERINIFGYSMGGYVGMLLAKEYPEKIGKLVTLATKFNWDPVIAANESRYLEPEKIEQKLPSFAEELQKRHSPQDWKTVLHKTKEMLLALGQQNTLNLHDYKEITTPSLLLLGDRDKMVTTEETIAVYEQMPNAQFGILPSTPHPIEQVNITMLSFFINEFLDH